jgi:hypothetical protein
MTVKPWLITLSSNAVFMIWMEILSGLQSCRILFKIFVESYFLQLLEKLLQYLTYISLRINCLQESTFLSLYQSYQSPLFTKCIRNIKILVSSVSVVSGYGLNDWAIEVQSPAGAKHFSCSLGVKTGFGAHPTFCSVGTGGPIHGG